MREFFSSSRFGCVALCSYAYEKWCFNKFINNAAINHQRTFATQNVKPKNERIGEKKNKKKNRCLSSSLSRPTRETPMKYIQMCSTLIIVSHTQVLSSYTFRHWCWSVHDAMRINGMCLMIQKANGNKVIIWVTYTPVDRKAVRELTFRSRRMNKKKSRSQYLPSRMGMRYECRRLPNSITAFRMAARTTHISYRTTRQAFCSRMSLLMIDLHAQVTSYKIYHRTHTLHRAVSSVRSNEKDVPFFVVAAIQRFCWSRLAVWSERKLWYRRNITKCRRTPTRLRCARTLCEYKTITALAANRPAMPMPCRNYI